ncbi:MAG TPA: agmatine deiminase family protein [Aliidongia sp.]|uniref:agmatine deiminase family protein n=1 Tax=Aliidongia sp. TaxID=1914230 RepID=UPI002DDCE402|nr:agmatine deiminase family protein [Aliidongia sp.]HEV2676977.1 agmatine deiminase family protein [Aliidongia sp.]
MTAPTPAEAGFHMPAEGARHTKTWMAWPSRIDLWNGRHVEAKAAYAAVAQAIARFEPLTMVANPADLADAAAQCGPSVEVLPMALDDSWMRDIGPTFLLDGKGALAGADWRFNAWGDKWPDYANDAAIAAQVLERVGCPRFAAPFVLEGGSIHSDGEGTVLTSEQCLLNPNRNPDLSKAQIEANLKAWLGAQVVIWVGQGLENDGTDGHVDNLACFARPGVVLATSCRDPQDANYTPMQDNLRRLAAARDARGRALEVLELPIPAKRVTAGGRLAMTYTNFYLANGAVIAPSFDDPMDAVAAGVLAKAFPDRQIVQVPALAILEGGGGIHCITQQQPAV